MFGANYDYANPEMLFTALYSACFDSALNLIIKKGKVKTRETSVNLIINIEQIEKGV
jgi:osmotically inducible protein OsmC